MAFWEILYLLPVPAPEYVILVSRVIEPLVADIKSPKPGVPIRVTVIPLPYNVEFFSVEI